VSFRVEAGPDGPRVAVSIAPANAPDAAAAAGGELVVAAADEDRSPVFSPARRPSTATAAKLEERRLYWAKKHDKRKRYADQHNKDSAWFKHKKHVLVLSWAGRPIFTRYGDDSALAAYMGVISAIVMNFQRHDDRLRSIIAGCVRAPRSRARPVLTRPHASDHKMVFLLRGPMYLVCIARTSETCAQLAQQLDYVYQQILAVLTGAAARARASLPALRESRAARAHRARRRRDQHPGEPAHLRRA
jgi:hypothetical protein